MFTPTKKWTVIIYHQTKSSKTEIGKLKLKIYIIKQQSGQ